MVFKMFFGIVILSMIAISLAQVPGTGPCAEKKTMPNYDPLKISGQWYGYSAFPNCEPRGRCRRTEFIDIDHDGSMDIIQKQLSIIPNTFGIHETVNRGVYLGDGTYLLTQPEDASYVNVTFTVWKTDYVSYMVKGLCVNVGPSSLNYVWTLTRSPNPSESVVEKINEALVDEEIQKKYLVRYDQTNCPIEY